MGALASLDQREEVRKAIQALRALRRDRVRRPRPRRRSSTPTPSAARSSPRCCCAPPTGAVEPHDVEPFGPVSTVHRPTTPSTRRSTLAARGKGSLVGSLVTHDPRRRPRRSTLGLAPWHGRILVLDRDDAGRVHRPRLPAADAGARRPGPGRRRRGARRHPRRAPPHAAHRDPGLARHADRDHRPLDHRLARAATTACTRSARASPSCASATPSRRRRARSRSPTSTTSRSSPATRSTPTPTPRPRPRTRCSAASSRTATSSSRWPPACSSTPTRARCWPTSASTTCGS